MQKETSAINDIREYIQKLKNNLDIKIKENFQLNEKIINSKNEVNHLKSKINELNEQIKLLKLASIVSTSHTFVVIKFLKITILHQLEKQNSYKKGKI